jgi:hypothetical protein
VRRFRAVALAALLAAGCGGPPDRGAAVRGRVTCDGRPLAGGLIVFTPDAEHGQHGPGAHARLDDDGRYELRDRLAPGWYRVTVAGPVDVTPGAPRVADRYRYPERSGLSARVGDQEEYEFNFTLEGP